MQPLKISKEIKTAIIVIGGILLFIVGFNYLMSNPLFDSSRTYKAVFQHSRGITAGTPVTVNGQQIGSVSEVVIRDKDAKIVITFKVDSNFQFSKNSKVELFSSLLGNTGLQVIPALDGAENAPDGMYLSSKIQAGMMESVTDQLGPLKQKLEHVLVSIDSLVTNVNSLMDDERKASLKASIDNFKNVTDNLSNATASLDGMLAENKVKIAATLDNAQTVTGNIAAVTDTLAQADIAGALKDFNASMSKLNGVMTQVENGEGNLGKLLKDEKMYNNLEGATRQLEQLLQDMKLNPKRYVHFSIFGKKNKSPCISR